VDASFHANATVSSGPPSATPDDLNGLQTSYIAGPIPLAELGPRTSKPCSRCGRELPFEAFNREGRARDGRRADCRECQHVGARAAYAAASGRGTR
jgi:hypothetical protein